MIKGWEKGLWGMCVGFGCMSWLMGSEKRRLVIPAGLAYGNRGAGDLIPAGRCERDDSRKGATLVFDVELIGIRGKGKYANKFLVSTNTLLLHNQYTCLRDLDLGQQVDHAVHKPRRKAAVALARSFSAGGSFARMSIIHDGVSEVPVTIAIFGFAISIACRFERDSRSCSMNRRRRTND